MEKGHKKLDTDFFEESLSHDLDNDIKRDMKPPSIVAGENFNLASPKQLGDVLFDKLKSGGQTKENKNRPICNREEKS
jgi:DNA polymerase-1